MRLVNIIATILLLLFGSIILGILISYAYRFWLKIRFRIRYGSQGRFVLFVYSNSPNWKDYIESKILPRIDEHAVTLNWSERKKWKTQSPFEARVFRRWAGESEFNPIAIVLPPNGKVKVVRFWQAFKDYKHGRDHTLKRAEEELFKEVDRLLGKPV